MGIHRGVPLSCICVTMWRGKQRLTARALAVCMSFLAFAMVVSFHDPSAHLHILASRDALGQSPEGVEDAEHAPSDTGCRRRASLPGGTRALLGRLSVFGRGCLLMASGSFALVRDSSISGLRVSSSSSPCVGGQCRLAMGGCDVVACQWVLRGAVGFCWVLLYRFPAPAVERTPLQLRCCPLS